MEWGKYYKNVDNIEGRYTGSGFLVWEPVKNSYGKFTPKTLVVYSIVDFGIAEPIADGMETEVIPL